MSRSSRIRAGWSFGCAALLLLLAAARPVAADIRLGSGVEFLCESEPTDANWTMKFVDPSNLPSGWDSAVLLPGTLPEYLWWQGCSPAVGGMMFAHWDTYWGKSNLYTFHDGNSTYWDSDHMDATVEDDYGRNGAYPDRATHSIVASWEHHRAGQGMGLTYGSWDRNRNGTVDETDRAEWDCLADFMLTEDGATYRSDIAQGLVDYAAWDDPATPLSESYDAAARTEYTAQDGTWSEYTSEIDAGRSVHVGLPGHSVFGCGYWNDPDGVYGATGTDYVVNRTTWIGSSEGKFGLIEFSEVYAYTVLHVGAAVPEPSSLALLVSLVFATAGLPGRRTR